MVYFGLWLLSPANGIHRLNLRSRLSDCGRWSRVCVPPVAAATSQVQPADFQSLANSLVLIALHVFEMLLKRSAEDVPAAATRLGYKKEIVVLLRVQHGPDAR